GRLCRVALGPQGRLVETSHTPFEASRLRYTAYRVTSRASDLWTNVCREGLETHLRVGAVREPRARLVRNGTPSVRGDVRAELRARGRTMLGLGSEFVWLAVGSFRDEAKDFGTLLAAFRRVASDEPTVKLLIAGEGALRADKERLAREL